MVEVCLSSNKLPLQLKYDLIVKLEYNITVWQCSIKLEQKIEAVQRHITKMLPGFKNLTYPECLKALNLPTLHKGRLSGDYVQVYKYIRGNYDIDYKNLLVVVVTKPKQCPRGHDC